MSDEIQLPHVWTADHTEAWLRENPLPADFVWPHRDRRPDGGPNLRPVLPSYAVHKGYGFWLRTTPYFPGLFEEIHALLVRVPATETLPTPEELAGVLRANAAKGEQLEISTEPLPCITDSPITPFRPAGRPVFVRDSAAQIPANDHQP